MYKKFDRTCMILFDIYWYLLYRKCLVENWFDYLFFLIDFVCFYLFFFYYVWVQPPAFIYFNNSTNWRLLWYWTRYLLHYGLIISIVDGQLLRWKSERKSSETVWRMIQQSGDPWIHTCQYTFINIYIYILCHKYTVSHIYCAPHVKNDKVASGNSCFVFTTSILTFELHNEFLSFVCLFVFFVCTFVLFFFFTSVFIVVVLLGVGCLLLLFLFFSFICCFVHFFLSFAHFFVRPFWWLFSFFPPEWSS